MPMSHNGKSAAILPCQCVQCAHTTAPKLHIPVASPITSLFLYEEKKNYQRNFQQLFTILAIAIANRNAYLTNEKKMKTKQKPISHFEMAGLICLVLLLGWA